ITLGTVSSEGTYASPLTITSTGTVLSSTGDAIDGPDTNAWSVANYGTVESTIDFGISLGAGGSVTNGQSGSAGGYITAASNGVEIYLTGTTSGTVTNFGTITATSAYNAIG